MTRASTIVIFGLFGCALAAQGPAGNQGACPHAAAQAKGAATQACGAPVSFQERLARLTPEQKSEAAAALRTLLRDCPLGSKLPRTLCNLAELYRSARSSLEALGNEADLEPERSKALKRRLAVIGKLEGSTRKLLTSLANLSGTSCCGKEADCDGSKAGGGQNGCSQSAAAKSECAKPDTAKSCCQAAAAGDGEAAGDAKSAADCPLTSAAELCKVWAKARTEMAKMESETGAGKAVAEARALLKRYGINPCAEVKSLFRLHLQALDSLCGSECAGRAEAKAGGPKAACGRAATALMRARDLILATPFATGPSEEASPKSCPDADCDGGGCDGGDCAGKSADPKAQAGPDGHDCMGKLRK